MAAPFSLAPVLDWLRAQPAGGQLTADSRSVSSGDIFFAYPGESADGRAYIAQAIERGAAAVVYESHDFAWSAAWQVPHLAVSQLKQHVGDIAAGYYGNPDRDMFVAAVTGTNGKTSTTQWLGAALSRLGDPTAVIGTLGAGVYRGGGAGSFESTGNTTPDAILLQRQLAVMRGGEVQAVAIEASSIGLAQQRMAGMHVDCAVFTNLTRDHLDYHGDMAAYEAAKMRLFDWLNLRHAVVNLDDEMGARIADRLIEANGVAIIGYSSEGATWRDVPVLQASDIRFDHAGTAFQLDSPYGAMPVKTRLIGKFNVSNVLAVIGVLLAKGHELAAAVAAVENLSAVPGRMQQLGGDEAPLVVIDYAHTPDALEKALATLREVASARAGKLWCVFGCGGDRDPGKRAQMGRASLVADRIIVTSDNPRSEHPAQIIAQIIQGMGGLENVHRAPQAIEDRATAILWAVKHADRRDVILLAGKGHETTQEIGGKKLPFLDADHAALALAARAMQKGAA